MADVGVNTSIYPQAGQNPFLDQASKMIGVANQVQQNKLLQQEGEIRGLNITQQQAQTYNTRLGLVAQELASQWGSSNGNPTKDHVISGVSNLMANNPEIFDKNFAAQVLSDLPSESDLARNPNAVKQWVLSHAQRTDQAQAALKPFLPNPTGYNYGPGTKYIDTNPVTNPRIIGTRVQNGLTPAEAATPTDQGVVQSGPNKGAVIRGALSQFLTKAQDGNPNPGGGAVAPGTVTPGPGDYTANDANGNPVVVDGKTGAAKGAGASPAPQQSPALTPQPAPANGANITTQGAAPGGIVMGLGVGAPEAETASAVAGTKQADALQTAAEGTQTRKGMLNNLEDDLKKFSSGPFAGTLGTVASGYNQAAGAVGLPQVAPEAVAAQENFRKQATQLAQQQFAAMGGSGSNDQLASAIHSNPNEALSKMGNRQIIQMLKGNEDALAAKNSAWQDWKVKNGANTYGKFQTEFNKTFEPRAFQFVYMTPDERTAALKNMTPNERSQVLGALATAEKNGWIRNQDGQ